MKKVFIIYLLILVNIFTINVIYAADACSSINFDELKCEIKLGPLANLGLSKKKTCQDTKVIPKKSYVDQTGSIHGVCYFEGDSNAYFYGVYKSNAKNTKCNLIYEAYFPVHRNASKLIEGDDEIHILLDGTEATASTGCANYFYVQNQGKSNESYVFSYEDTKKYEWFDQSGIGETSYDQSDVDGIENCVLNKISLPNCNNLNDYVSDAIKSCIESSKPGFSGEKFDQLALDVNKELVKDKKIESVSLFCQFKNKCNVSNEKTFLSEFTKWRTDLEKNTGSNNYYGYSILQNYFTDPNIASCISGTYNNESEKKELENKVDELENVASETIDKTVDETKKEIENYKDSDSTLPVIPPLDIDDNVGTCSEILGPSLTKLVKAAVRILQIGGVIATIVNAMISLIPAITSKDQEGLKKAVRKCIYMAIVLVLLLLLGTIIKLIGMVFGFDTSCFI